MSITGLSRSPQSLASRHFMQIAISSQRGGSQNAISVYLQLTLVFSAAVWILIIWSGHVNMGYGLIIPAIMWCPALAALLTSRLLGRKLGSLGWRWPQPKHLAGAYLVPLAYASVAYGAVWTLQLGGWNSEFVRSVAEGLGLKGLPAWASFTLAIICMATGGVIQNVSMTLGEEIGWRGLLVPELAKRMSYTKTSLVSGLIWAAWHSPLLLFADYNAGTNRWYALSCFSFTCISMSFMLAWFRLKSDSLWPAALFHASHNVFLPIVFDNLTRDTGHTLLYTTVFGAAPACTSALFALYFWTRREEVDLGGVASGRADERREGTLVPTRDRRETITSTSHTSHEEERSLLRTAMKSHLSQERA
jgi:membrane protease YdiL (CAAX protease family)